MTVTHTYIGEETGHEVEVQFADIEEVFDEKTMAFKDGVTELFVRTDLLSSGSDDAKRSEQDSESGGAENAVAAPQSGSSEEQVVGPTEDEESADDPHSALESIEVDELEWPTLQKLASHFDLDASKKVEIISELEEGQYDLAAALAELGHYDG